MSDVDKALGRRREAETIQETALFQEAIATIRAYQIGIIVDSKPEEGDKREAAYHAIRGLDLIPNFLAQVVVDHKMAENAEARKPKLK